MDEVSAGRPQEEATRPQGDRLPAGAEASRPSPSIAVAGGVTVRVANPPHEAYDALLTANAPTRLHEQDPALWGPDAVEEASIRLGWVDTFERSRALVPMLAELRDELSDLDHVVL